MSDKVKVFEVNPAGNTMYDTHIVEAGENDETELNYAVNESINRQLDESDEDPELCPFEEIKVVITTGYMSREELDGME